MTELPTLLVPGSLRLPTGKVPTDTTPVKYITSWIRDRMSEFGSREASLANRVLIVKAETGSGKSTILPVAVFRILHGDPTPASRPYRGKSVICTQPRVLTAVDLAKKAPLRNPDMILGKTVGYQTRPLSDRPPSGLIYSSTGILTIQLVQSDDTEIMDKYQTIIVDEAHERSLTSDVTLLLLKNFYERNAGNRNLPFLILASATIDPALYAGYFGVPGNVFAVTGRSYPIDDDHWLSHGTNDYLAEAAAVAVRIHEEHPDDPPEKADVLIFVPGSFEAAAVSRALSEQKPSRGALLILVINRDVVNSQTGDYTLLFEKPSSLPLVDGKRPSRRVIISTVVAETGLTIDTLRYVIDCGWNRTTEVYQPWDVRGLITRPAPRSRITQRKGRVGRLFPGEAHSLYTKKVYDALEGQQLPEVITSGVAEVYLTLVREQQRRKRADRVSPEFRVEDLSLLDPPPPEAFLSANAVAVALGFVSARTAQGYGLTPLGELGAAFTRVPMEGIRVILAGYVWNAAASDLETVVALFGVQASGLLLKGATGSEALQASLPPFLAQRTGGAEHVLTETEATYYRSRLLIADDFVEALLIFSAFARQNDISRGDIRTVTAWCEDAGLSFSALVKIAQRREEIIEDMIVAGLNPYRLSDHRLSALPMEGFTDGLIRVKRCLYDGLRCRLLRYDRDGPGYVTKQGLLVKTPALFTDAMADRLGALGVARADWRPRWIVTDQVRLVPARGRIRYSVEANLVSVLDGYVDPDPEFDEPRSFGTGPQAQGGPQAPADAAARLRTYERIVRLVLAGKDGALSAPVLRLTDERLVALFAPKQLDSLVKAPLGRKALVCG